MDALLTSFIAAGLAEWGDKTQLLVALLAARYLKPGAVLAGVLVGAAANSFLAAAGGFFISDLITPRALSLLIALAMAFAGIAGLIGKSTPDMGLGWRTGAFLTTAACFFLLEFGDKTQFLTFAMAGRFDSLVLAGVGATAGIVAANVPAALLADRFAGAVPLKGIRIGIACLFLLIAFIVAINALMLV